MLSGSPNPFESFNKSTKSLKLQGASMNVNGATIYFNQPIAYICSFGTKINELDCSINFTALGAGPRSHIIYEDVENRRGSPEMRVQLDESLSGGWDDGSAGEGLWRGGGETLFLGMVKMQANSAVPPSMIAHSPRFLTAINTFTTRRQPMYNGVVCDRSYTHARTSVFLGHDALCTCGPSDLHVQLSP